MGKPWHSRIEWVAMAGVLVTSWWFLLVSRHGAWPWGTPLDLDSAFILRGLIAAGDGWGWHWWYGPWVQGGMTPYWRPLVSQIWLVEYRLWGSDWEAWRWASYAFHLALMFSLWGFAARFTRSRFVGFCVALMLTAIPNHLRWLTGWFPSQTSMLSDMGMLLSMWAFLSYLDGGKRLHLGLSLAAFFFAVACREVAFITPALALAAASARRKPWRVTWPFWATGLVLWAYRSAVLPPASLDLFQWSGSDPIRAIATLGGPIGDSLASLVAGIGPNGGALWSVALGVIIAIAVLFSASRPRSRVVTPFAVWVCGIVLAGVLLGDCSVGLCPADLLWPAMRMAVLVAGAILVWREGYGRMGLAAYALVVIFYAPIAGREQVYQQYELFVTFPILLGVGLGAIEDVFQRTRPRITLAVSWLFALWYAGSMLLVAHWPSLGVLEDLLFAWLGPLALLSLLYLAFARKSTQHAAAPGLAVLRQGASEDPTADF